MSKLQAMELGALSFKLCHNRTLQYDRTHQGCTFLSFGWRAQECMQDARKVWLEQNAPSCEVHLESGGRTWCTQQTALGVRGGRGWWYRHIRRRPQHDPALSSWSFMPGESPPIPSLSLQVRTKRTLSIKRLTLSTQRRLAHPLPTNYSCAWI